MAYAFQRMDDYFRRNKTGGAGGLQKGMNGAPPPTAAAESLAKTAADNQGEAQTSGSQYQALKGANTSAIQGRLAGSAQKESDAWSAGAQNIADTANTAGQSQIESTYKPFNAADIGQAERGGTNATNNLTQQVGYTGNELSFAPVQVETPKFDTTSMLSSGVGGIQAALQRKGGRYTPGMGAMDATALAANRQAIGQLQSRLGGISSAALEKKSALEQTDENLSAAAKKRAEDTRKQVRDAIAARQNDLQAELWQKGSSEAAAADLASYNKSRAAIEAGIAGSGITNEQLEAMGISGGWGSPNSFLTSTFSQNTLQPTQAQSNLYAIMGGGPMDPYTVDQTTYGVDQAKLNAAIANKTAAYNAWKANMDAQRQAQIVEQQGSTDYGEGSAQGDSSSQGSQGGDVGTYDYTQDFAGNYDPNDRSDWFGGTY